MINPKKEIIEINGLLLLHQKTKSMLIKKIEDLLIALDTAEAKSKLQQQQIDKVTAKAKEILNYLREPLIINYQEHFSNLSRNFS